MDENTSQNVGIWTAAGLAIGGSIRAAADYFSNKNKKYIDQLQMALERINKLEEILYEKGSEIENLNKKLKLTEELLLLNQIELKRKKMFICEKCKEPEDKNEEC
jgi:hypothetical protein